MLQSYDIIHKIIPLPYYIKTTVTSLFLPSPQICQNVFHVSVPQFSLSIAHAIILQTRRENCCRGWQAEKVCISCIKKTQAISELWSCTALVPFPLKSLLYPTGWISLTSPSTPPTMNHFNPSTISVPSREVSPHLQNCSTIAKE